MQHETFTLAATTNDLTRASDARPHADVVEFRMDRAADPFDQLAAYDGELPILATNRGRWFGGDAVDDGRLDHLYAAARHDAVVAVDVELETVRGRPWVTREFRDAGVDVVVSSHDFEQTPPREVLDALFEECARYGDVAAVATVARSEREALRLLDSLDRATRSGLRAAGFSMGERGRHTRVVAPCYGSVLGYAPLEAGAAGDARGGFPLETLRALVDAVDGTDEHHVDCGVGRASPPEFARSD